MKTLDIVVGGQFGSEAKGRAPYNCRAACASAPGAPAGWQRGGGNSSKLSFQAFHPGRR